MATAAEIRNRALEELGVLRPGQDPDAAHAARVDQTYTEVYARLKECGVATWASTGSVPDELAEYVVAMVALNRVGTYGVSEARYSRILGVAGANGDEAIRQIRRLITPQYESADELRDF